MSIIVCLVTCPNQEVGMALARQVVDEQLAACVNIIPGIRSVYRWEGSIVIDEEVLLVVKTAEHLMEHTKNRILELHPYEVPEFVALSPTEVSEGYAKWFAASVLPRA